MNIFFAPKVTVSTCFCYLKESSSRNLSCTEDFLFSTWIILNILCPILCPAHYLKRAFCIIRTNFSKKKEKKTRIFLEETAKCMYTRCPWIMQWRRPRSLGGHAQKRLMDNHIRACPWWAFATIAHRSSSGPKSERFQKLPNIRWLMTMMTHGAQLWCGAACVVGADHRCIKCTVRSI